MGSDSAEDAEPGGGTMALVINPVGGYGIPLWAIAATSLSHTLSKGTVRLFLDKLYSVQGERRQAKGIVLTTLFNFLQGLTTSFVYAGSGIAIAVQAASACVGTTLVFG